MQLGPCEVDAPPTQRKGSSDWVSTPTADGDDEVEEVAPKKDGMPWDKDLFLPSRVDLLRPEVVSASY